MAKYKYTGNNVRILNPLNAPVSKEYKFGPGGCHEVADVDRKVFNKLPEFEKVRSEPTIKPTRAKTTRRTKRTSLQRH